MKILQVSNFFKPSWETGGVTKVNYEISKNLAQRGHDVTVYTTDGFSSRLNVPKNKATNVDGIRVYYFYNLMHSLAKKMKITTPYYLPFVLRKEITNFDIIHIHEHRTFLAVIVHYYAIKYGIPYVLQSHGSVLPFLQKQTLKRIFDVVFGFNVLKDATKVIALNESEAISYKEMHVDPSKIEIMPNGINLSDYAKFPDKNTFRDKYSISHQDMIILYVGRLHKNKGLDLLVKSFAHIVESINNVKLIIVGPDGGFQFELEELADKLNVKENILFTGFVNMDDKIAALTDADVFVTPSFTGFPVSFLEACVFGLPIITTDEGDNLDWIHDRIGYVVQYDEDKLSNAILELLRDDMLRAHFGEESKKLIETNFSMENILNILDNVYAQCIPTRDEN